MERNWVEEKALNRKDEQYEEERNLKKGNH